MAFDKEAQKYYGWVYYIVNLINKKYYIGQTTQTTLLKRWKQHISTEKSNQSMIVCQAIQKYGKDNFIMEAIERIECENNKELKRILNEKEIFYIAQFHSHISEGGYNLTKGGNNVTTYIYKAVDVYDRYGMFLSTHESMTEAGCVYDVDPSDVSMCCNGKIGYSKQYVFRLHGEPLDKYDYHDKMSKFVLQFDLNWNFIKQFNSIDDAARSVGVGHKSIALCCDNLGFTCKDFYWKYKKDVVDPYNYHPNISTHIKVQPIYQYTLQGDFVTKYNNVYIAEKSTGFGRHEILKCCRTPGKSAQGFLWSFEMKEMTPYQNQIYRKVNKYDLNGIWITTYDMVRDAALSVGRTRSQLIIKHCNSDNHECYDFLWYYATDPTQPDPAHITQQNN